MHMIEIIGVIVLRTRPFSFPRDDRSPSRGALDAHKVTGQNDRNHPWGKGSKKHPLYNTCFTLNSCFAALKRLS
jgi:hypothetical protein